MASSDQEVITGALAKTSSLCSLALKSLRIPTAQTSRPSSALPSFPVLRQDYISLLSLIHSRALSLSLALKPPPTVAAVTKTLYDLNADLGRFTNCVLSIDDDAHGAEVRKQMRWGAEEVLEGVQRTVDGFAAGDVLPENGVDEGKRDLVPIGALLSSIERLKGTLPRDNKAAIVARWETDSAALEDGVREAREMIDAGDEAAKGGKKGDADDDDDDDDDDSEENGWGDLGEEFGDEELSGPELERAKKIFPLLRLVALLHKRLLTHHLKLAHVPPLSDSHVVSLFGHSTTLVSSMDELASSLYTPQDVGAMQTRVKDVDACAQQFKSVLDVWEAEKGMATLDVQDGKKKDDREAANRKWFDMCFVQIDKVVKDLEQALVPT